MKCECCENGEVWIPCCNGLDGCDCEGRLVCWGPCLVCDGKGNRGPDADVLANVKAMREQAKMSGGYFGNSHGRLR